MVQPGPCASIIPASKSQINFQEVQEAAMDLALQGKVAMITGGSHGLGKQAADSLAREGCKVAICARGQENLDATSAEFRSKGYEVLAVQADVMSQADLKDFHDQTVANLGEADILVNNAGGRKGTADFQETGVATFREGLEFNLMSPVELIALVLPHMREQRWGRIINISSIYGREYGGSIDYMTGKAALIAFSKHMALNLVKENVLVNCIAPGSIDFPGSSWDRFQQNSTPEEVAEFIDRNLPAGRFGWPEPIGDTVAFLASENANLITGTCLNVDGGQSRSLF
ncbi:MAG: short-chain dehydrogenase [Dehalococcoidia bacterium]|nr:MAG: short-chain dehydrogenase [Dehalococcoidia bacterium]HIM61219.1 SDR family NAD(P)-dependent oxidoreductase [Dehalococcoidia bacterium]HIN23802.1 SDR family NAD(P)-dependent oxidoreductase [Dehalococcoidia bacterium]